MTLWARERPPAWAVSIVDFLHHLPSLLQTKASQRRVGVEIRVGILVQYVPKKYVPGGQVLELPCVCFVIGKCPVFQVGNDGVPLSW